MSSNPRRATLLGAVIALMLLAAPAADAAAARLSTSVADDAAQSIADRYADATDADDSGVDRCRRQNRRVIACDVFVSISVDDDTQRECSATVLVKLGKARKAKPVVSQSRWRCEDSSLADADDDDSADDAPVDGGDEDPGATEEDGL
jgi:hypothetical protein